MLFWSGIVGDPRYARDNHEIKRYEKDNQEEESPTKKDSQLLASNVISSSDSIDSAKDPSLGLHNDHQ